MPVPKSLENEFSLFKLIGMVTFKPIYHLRWKHCKFVSRLQVIRENNGQNVKINVTYGMCDIIYRQQVIVAKEHEILAQDWTPEGVL